MKRTTEDVQKYFKEQGCELIGEYTRARDKLTYKCHCGNISTTIWSNFIKGHRCGLCKEHGPKKKRSLKEVQKIFKERGCEFLDNEFIKCTHKHNYKCKCGHIGKTSLFSFHTMGSDCYYCGLEKAKLKNEANREIQAKKVKKYFKSHKCELLDDYKASDEKMKFICSCGHKGKITWDDFKQGGRCGFCGKNGRIKKYTLLEVQKIFKDRGCEFLDNFYKNSSFKHNYKCKCGYVGKVTFGAFYHQNQNCYDCGIKKLSSKFDEMRAECKIRRKFRSKCYQILEHTYKSINGEKKDHSHKILGYSANDLRTHIENHKNWGRVKDEKWHIDHIFPIKAFVDFGILDVKLINCLENLQPLTQKENLIKNSKYNKNKFIKWLSLKGVKEYNGNIK